MQLFQVYVVCFNLLVYFPGLGFDLIEVVAGHSSFCTVPNLFCDLFFMCRLSSDPFVHTILGRKICTIVIVELADLVATVSSVLGFVLLRVEAWMASLKAYWTK